jgi:hypothetical protein
MSKKYQNDGLLKIKGLNLFSGITFDNLHDVLNELINQECDSLITMIQLGGEYNTDDKTRPHMQRLRTFIWALEQVKKQESAET